MLHYCNELIPNTLILVLQVETEPSLLAEWADFIRHRRLM